jgi:hypothetical protein
MTTRFLIGSFVLLGAPLWAANFSGKWLLTADAVVTLNQVGAEVTGSITPPRNNYTGSPVYVDVLGGKADGDTLTFYVWTGLDKPVKNIYKGKLTGDEIVFTVTMDPTDGNAPRTFQVTAKRVP